ncbi:hypothetical protein Tco_1245723 [Tanacetum coccineum]
METKMELTKVWEADVIGCYSQDSHLNAMKRIFKYLRANHNLGLWLSRESYFDLEAYSGCDYAMAKPDMKSQLVVISFWMQINFMAMQETNHRGYLYTELNIVVACLQVVVDNLLVKKVSSGGGKKVSASQREGMALLEGVSLRPKEQRNKSEKSRLRCLKAQKKRMAQVQEAARFYTEEDWETIRVKLEANADLVKEIVGEDVSETNYAQRIVGLWLMDIEKESRKRTCVEFQQNLQEAKSSQGSMFLILKKDCRRTDLQSLALRRMLKSLHGEKSGRDMNHLQMKLQCSSIPQGPAPTKIVKWQIIKTGKRGAYQIIREDNTDVEAHNEDIQRNLKFTSKDQVRGGLLGIIINRLKSGSYRVKSGRHS